MHIQCVAMSDFLLADVSGSAVLTFAKAKTGSQNIEWPFRRGSLKWTTARLGGPVLTLVMVT